MDKISEHIVTSDSIVEIDADNLASDTHTAGILVPYFSGGVKYSGILRKPSNGWFLVENAGTKPDEKTDPAALTYSNLRCKDLYSSGDLYCAEVSSSALSSGVVVSSSTGKLSSIPPNNYSLLYSSTGGTLSWIGNAFTGSTGTVYGSGSGSGDVFAGTTAETTLFGYRTGNAMTASTGGCSLFGHNAGLFVTSGSYITAVGRTAGYGITTSSHTTAIGANTVQQGNVSKCTFTGSGAGRGQAGLTTSASTENTGSGFEAMNFVTTGAYDTCVGSQALRSLTTGSYHSAFGYYAGRDTLSGGTGCTLIGALTSVPDANPVNRLALGYNVQVTSDNTGIIGNAGVTNVFFGHHTIMSAGAGSAYLGSSQNPVKGIYLATTGGTPTPLTYHEESNATVSCSAFAGNFTANPTCTMRWSRTGKQVTCTFVFSGTFEVSSGTPILRVEYGAAGLTRLNPYQLIVGTCWTYTGGANVVGSVTVNTDYVSIAPGYGATFSGAVNEIYPFSISWLTS